MSAIAISPNHSIPQSINQSTEYHPNVSLCKIHKKINDLSWIGCFLKGIRSTEKDKSLCAKVACRVFMATSGLCVVAFSGASFLFGYLALKQGISDYTQTSKAPIIGHFSEWSMQGLLALSWVYNGVNAVKDYGQYVKIQEIFIHYLETQGLSPKQREEIYDDYLDFLASQPLPNYFSTPLFPLFPKSINASPDGNRIQVDAYFNSICNEIEESIAKVSFITQIMEGLKLIQSGKSSCKTTLFKTTLIAEGLFIAAHLANYMLGIYWSGEQALNEFSLGKNPSIGGHSLEWSVEASALLINVIYLQLNEIANVGKAKLIVDLFHQKIDALSKDAPQNSKLTDRLFWTLTRQIRRFPKGMFFQVPNHLPFYKKKKIEEQSELEEIIESK